MRILVTGRDGQLARSLAEVARGHEMLFAGRPDFDLADPAGMERAIERARPDVIVNAAAYTAVDAAEDDADAAMAINGVAPGAIARAAARIGARMVQVSTDYVFDGKLYRPYREDDATAPLGVYGRTKLAGEAGVAASGADAIVVRTAWVYSPFGANFVKTMLRLAETRDEVAVVADQFGCPTSALDLADAVVRLVAAWPVAGGRIFHAAGDGTASWADFAGAVLTERERLTGDATAVRRIPTADYPTRARRPANSVMDCTKLARAIGSPLPDWRASARQVVGRIIGDQRATT